MADPRLDAIRAQAAAYPDGDLAYVLARLDAFVCATRAQATSPTSTRRTWPRKPSSPSCPRSRPMAYTYDDLRSLPDDWDGEPNAAHTSETSLRVLQSLEVAVRAAGLPADPEPDAWQGCGFFFESSAPDVHRTAWLHVADRGTVTVVLTKREPGVYVESLTLDPADPGPALAKVVAFLAGASDG